MGPLRVDARKLSFVIVDELHGKFFEVSSSLSLGEGGALVSVIALLRFVESDESNRLNVVHLQGKKWSDQQ